MHILEKINNRINVNKKLISNQNKQLKLLEKSWEEFEQEHPDWAEDRDNIRLHEQEVWSCEKEIEKIKREQNFLEELLTGGK